MSDCMSVSPLVRGSAMRSRTCASFASSRSDAAADCQSPPHRRTLLVKKKPKQNKQSLKKNNKKNSQNKIKAHMGLHKHTHSRGKSLESAHASAYFKSQVLFFFLFQLGAGGRPKKKKKRTRKFKALILLFSPPPGRELLQTTRRIHTWEIHGHTGNPAQLKNANIQTWK